MDLKPCRDCGTPVQYTSRSCPHCGIMNPVAKWVALPDGEDEKFRVPVTPYSAMTTAARSAAVLSRPPRTTMQRIFGPVTDAEDAKEAIDWCSGIFYLLALIQAALAMFDGRAHLVDAAVLAGLATWLRMGNSRVAAVLLLILSVLWAGMGVMSFSYRTVWMSVIAIGLSWRAFNAAGILQQGRQVA